MKGVRVLSCLMLLVLLFTACQPGAERDPQQEGTTAPPEVLTEDMTVYQKFDHINCAFFFEDSEKTENQMISAAADLCMSRDRYRLVKVTKQFGISSSDFVSARSSMDTALKNGSELLFAAGPAFYPILRELAVEYPDVMFFCFGTRETNSADNLFSITCDLYEGFYLAGLAAAEESRSGRIAYVADAGTPRADVLLCANAFALGAKALDPNVSVAFSTADENRSALAEVRLLAANGYDFFAGNFSEEVCRQTGERAILLAPPGGAEEGAFGTVTVDLSETVASVLEAAADEVPQTDRFVGIKEDVISLNLSESASEETRTKVAAVYDALVSDRFAVFSGFRPGFDENFEMTLEPAAILSQGGSELVPSGEQIRNPASLFAVSTVAGLTERG